MRIECPKCDARIKVSEDDESDTIKCPECGVKFRMAEDDDEDDAPKSAKKKSGKKKQKDEEKTFPMVPVVAGGVGLLAVVGIVLAVVLSGGKKEKEKETASNTNTNTPIVPQQVPIPGTGTGPIVQGGPNAPPNSAPPPPPLPGTNPPKKDPPVGPPVNQPAAGIPPQFAALFNAKVPDSAPATVRGASLRPTSSDLTPDVPSFHSLMMARKEAKNPNPMTAPVPKNAKMSVDDLKKAAAYIKVETNDGGGTGSGFLIYANGSTALVATNHHVIADAVEARYGNLNAKITVVFNSGLTDERSHKGEVVAYDPVADLAVIRIESAKEWPKVLNPYHATNKPPTEGTALKFYGFPLGDVLSKISKSKRNPEISVGIASVASFRHNEGGKLDRIQISGTLNPGNSGGPIVDDEGRLVGLAVSGIKTEFATGIGFAVPVADLIALLEGKLLATIFVPIELEKNNAVFVAVAPIMDPMNRVETVFVRRWAGGGKVPPFVKDPFTGYKPFAMRADGKANLPGADEFPLEKLPREPEDPSALGLAIGELTVPLDSEQVLIQVASQSGTNSQGYKTTAASKPVSYTLKVEDLPEAKDMRPLTDLTANSDSLAGRVLVVQARIAAPPITREAVQDLIITGMKGEPVTGIKFLVDRELASQFDEVEHEHQPLPVRLVCLVGSRVDGLVPVRITRVDFVGRSKRVVRTIPAAPLTWPELANLNRDPAKFAGQTLTMKCGLIPYAVKPKPEPGEIRLTLPGMPARNLKATINQAMFARMVEKMGPDQVRPDSTAVARVTAIVPKSLDLRDRIPVTVTKIEFLNSEDKVIATIE